MKVVDTRVKDVNELAQTVFSDLCPLVIEDVADEGGFIGELWVLAQILGSRRRGSRSCSSAKDGIA